MIFHYLVIAYRNLWRNRLHSILNILGLTIGITCFILIVLFVNYELSYDRFNSNAKRVYRIAVNGMIGNTEIHQTGTPPPLPAALYQEFPEIEAVTRLMNVNNFKAYYNKKSFTEENLFVADSSFLKIFEVKLTKGNKALALKQPGVVIITERMANKYFGNEDPLNKAIHFKYGNMEFDFSISGVMEEFPANSHIHPDFIIPMVSLKGLYDSKDWSNNAAATYMMLKPHSNYRSVEAKFPDLISKYFFQGGSYAKWEQQGNYWRYTLQPLTKIHLTSKLNGEFEPNGNGTYVYILSIAAVFVLVIACINYMNLYTAKSMIRAKEIGIRKSFGSSRMSLIKQLLMESILLTFIAALLAIFLVDSVLPYYNNFTGKPLEFHFTHPMSILVLLVFIIFVGSLSGSYPALYLSSLNPISILKQKSGNPERNLNFRNILVIVQFTLSICMIAGTMMVFRQLNYMRFENLGVDKENVLVIKNIAALGKNTNTFIQKLISNPHIQNASASSDVFGSDFINVGYGAEGKQNFTLNTFICDTSYADVLKLKMAVGRFFSSRYSADSSAIVINEAAAKMLEWNDPLNKQLNLFAFSKRLNVIGVVKDFNYESRQTKIRPMGIILQKTVENNRNYPNANFILARFVPGNNNDNIQYIRSLWDELSNGDYFKYSFLTDEYDNLYRNEVKSQKLFLIFSILSILIAALGLFGLASYMAIRRTKEVGLRKVNGSTRLGILLLLSESFVKWVIIAFLIGCPICWFVLARWLKNFAYHASLSWWIFLLAGVFALFIALLTVSWQSWRAATRNPVEALRYE